MTRIFKIAIISITIYNGLLAQSSNNNFILLDSLVDYYYCSNNSWFNQYYGRHCSSQVLTPEVLENYNPFLYLKIVDPSTITEPKNNTYLSLTKSCYVILTIKNHELLKIIRFKKIQVETCYPYNYANVYVGNELENLNLIGKARHRRSYVSVPDSINYRYVKIESISNDTVYGFKLLNAFLTDPENNDVFFKEKSDTMHLILNNVNFAFDSYSLDDNSKEYLDSIILQLKELTNIEIQIIGHTDSIGHIEYNQKLSLSRAKEIYNYLIKKGFNKESLSFTGMGEEIPLSYKDNMYRNRRCELVIIHNK